MNFMNRFKVGVYILAFAFAVLSCTACSKGETSNSADIATVDEVQTGAKESTADGKDDYYEFDLQLSARDGDYVYICDDIFEDNIDKYEINGNRSQFPFKGSRICVDGETIYYVKTSTKENEEETWELYSYSKNNKESTFYLEVPKWTNFLMRCNGVIYYQDDTQINAYDIQSHKKIVLIKDNIVSSYVADSRIYYLSSAETNENYIDNGTLKYYDLGSKKTGVMMKENIKSGNICKSGSNVFFWTTENENHPRSAQVYKVNTEKNTVDSVKTLKTDGELFFVACYNSILVYQEFDYQTGAYSTSAMSLTDVKIQTDENANFQLIASNSHSVGNDAKCVLKDESNHKDFYFDTKSGKVKKVTNSDGDRYADYYYCDGEVCMYEALGDYERNVAETLKLSDDISFKEDVNKTVPESSPDGEYVHKKMYVPNTCGYVSPVPELIINSDDARKINSEMESCARTSEYNMYYHYLVSDNYMTIFLYSGHTGGGYYKIYTLDIITGKRLTNSDIIALYSVEADAFFGELREEYKYQQDFTYKYGQSQMEADLSGRELIEGKQQLSNEEIESYAAKITIDNIQLGYYGESELICSASFKNYAGAESKSHIFKYKLGY